MSMILNTSFKPAGITIRRFNCAIIRHEIFSQLPINVIIIIIIIITVEILLCYYSYMCIYIISSPRCAVVEGAFNARGQSLSDVISVKFAVEKNNKIVCETSLSINVEWIFGGRGCWGRRNWNFAKMSTHIIYYCVF